MIYYDFITVEKKTTTTFNMRGQDSVQPSSPLSHAIFAASTLLAGLHRLFTGSASGDEKSYNNITKSTYPKLKWQHQHTLEDHQVDYIFREPFMLTGYRIPNRNWMYYVASLFQAHNEVFNVWTHLIAFFAFLYKVNWWLSHETDPFSEPYTWPLLAFTVGTLSYSALSTVAHLFQSKSELAHYTFFQLDYIGIGLNATGSALLTYYFSGSQSFYQALGHPGCRLYEIGNYVLGFAVCVSCSLAKLFYLRPYTFMQMFLKMGVCGIHLLYGFMPLFYRVYHRLFVNESHLHDGDLSVHIGYMITFFLAVFFYATSTPERLKPGRFDLFGYGHGLFHIAMALTSWQQFSVSRYELNIRRQFMNSFTDDITDNLHFPEPCFRLIFGGLALTVLSSIVFVVYTHSLRVRRVELLRSGTLTPRTSPCRTSNANGSPLSGCCGVSRRRSSADSFKAQKQC